MSGEFYDYKEKSDVYVENEKGCFMEEHSACMDSRK